SGQVPVQRIAVAREHEVVEMHPTRHAGDRTRGHVAATAHANGAERRVDERVALDYPKHRVRQDLRPHGASVLSIRSMRMRGLEPPRGSQADGARWWALAEPA